MPQTTASESRNPEIDTEPVESQGRPPDEGTASDSTGGSDPTGSSAEAAAQEDTGVPPQNQVETAAPTPAKTEETLAERIARRQAQVEADLSEREAFILKYVRERFPLGYYRRAKAEGNEFFQQAVIYRLRRHRHGKTPSKR